MVRVKSVCLLLALSTTSVMVAAAQAAEIPGWGNVVDPDGDCTIRGDAEKLTIGVPQGLHDLWPGRPVAGQSFNAPRVWQEVEGDFVAQVKVTADWEPYPADVNYGAGLVVWDSEIDLLRYERHVFMYQGKPSCFTKPLYLRNSKRVDDRLFTPAGFYQGRSTWLRVERIGQDIKTSVSHDGSQWQVTGTIATAFPAKVKVGVHVIKVSPGKFSADFEEYRLTRSRTASGTPASGTRAATAVTSTATEIGGWGNVVDPDGDCTITPVDAGKVTIRIPGTRHDMWYGGKEERTRFNAPRILRAVEGDFVATVQVTADWDSGITEGGYNGGGLVIWDSPKQYLRNERNRYVSAPGRAPATYFSPQYDQNDRRVYFCVTPDQIYQGRSTWVKLRRTGNTIASSYYDGSAWKSNGIFETEFPARVQVGVIAVNSTKREFTVEFQSLTIERP